MPHHFVAGSNTIGFVTRGDGSFALDQRGDRIPIPFPCHECLEPACYGEEGLWYCSQCWQNYLVADEDVKEEDEPA